MQHAKQKVLIAAGFLVGMTGGGLVILVVGGIIA